jgi:hypothetical protein
VASYHGRVNHHEARFDDEDDLRPVTRLHSMQGIPDDARTMGIDRNVTEGAWLAFAGSLRATKPSHRLVAWLMLAAIVLPLVLTLKSELF